MCGFKQGYKNQDTILYNDCGCLRVKRKNTKDIVLIGSSVCEMAINV